MALAERVDAGGWGLAPRFPTLPLMFSLKVTKPA